ncbi:hypothetical protein BSLG_004582 [Batrachochytrium salamandrivorans]|nr:hypothetical protein BSLG_004582 [Batrachochytrium salamandrivorans]
MDITALDSNSALDNSPTMQLLPSPSPLSPKLQSILYHLEYAAAFSTAAVKQDSSSSPLTPTLPLPASITPTTATPTAANHSDHQYRLPKRPCHGESHSIDSSSTADSGSQDSSAHQALVSPRKKIHLPHRIDPDHQKSKLPLAKEDTPPADLLRRTSPALTRVKRQRRLSNHITLAKTAVGLREIAKKIGMANMRWESSPKNAMIVTKLHDRSLVQLTLEAAHWLTSRGITVYVQKELFDQEPKAESTDQSESAPPSPDLNGFKFWDKDFGESPLSPTIDFVITFGGDGTVLFAAWLFQTIVPPIIPFNLGSLGFLTVHPHNTFKTAVQRVLDNDEAGVRMNFRMRFACTIKRKTKADGTCMADHGAVYHILNDMVVDRGPSPYLSQLELYGDEKHLTTIQADGLVIATPTGSTAYSLSAGGSVVHPDVSAIMVSPICPHTLSFRPMILPDTMDVKIVVPRDSRATAWMSFDGRHRVQLQPGDSIHVCASQYAVPTVCKSDQSTDWFRGLEECLAWNRRDRQKELSIS